jgi:hypothetical protein
MIDDVIPFVHKYLESLVSNEDICIDATAGNGYDTLFLANKSKHVLSFDIQDLAIKNTKNLLDKNGMRNVTLIQDSHEYMKEYVTTKVKAIVFNLGYLPGGDKSIVTRVSSTIKALKSSIDLLCSGGAIFITVYIGHDGGVDESNELIGFVKKLDKSTFKSIKYEFLNRDNAPYVIIIEKKK